MKKLLAVGVIVLFLGLAIAPSINANVSKTSVDSELVEITTEICGLNGGKHTVSLSKEDAEEVEALFDSIRERLNATETREDTEQIFKEAVVELDEYGLLGGLSVKQAQKLVNGEYQNSRIMKLMERIYEGNLGYIEENENFLCSITGETRAWTEFFGPVITCRCLVWTGIRYFLEQCYDKLDSHGFERLAEIIGALAVISSYIPLGLIVLFWFIHPYIPVSFVHTIAFGVLGGQFGPEYYPAEGWVHTIGLNGVKEWNGKFFGKIGFAFPHLSVVFYPGVIGFTGIKIGIHKIPILAYFFLGSAIGVKLGPEHP